MSSGRPEVSPERVTAYAEMFGVALKPGEAAAIASQLAAGLAGLEPFRTLDLTDIEPFVVFPIDRLST